MSSLVIPSLHVDARSEIPVYRQIADGIRRALEHGVLAPGRRLPPTRDLAAQRGVNRNSVVAAYEYLVEQGIASGQTGRGTFIVSPRGSDEPDWPTSFARAVEGPGVGGLLAAYRVAVSPEGISFAASYPASDLMPVEAFRRAMEGTLREHGADVLTYGPPSGYAPLRDAIAVGMRARGSRRRRGRNPDHEPRAIVLITMGAFNVYFSLDADFNLADQHSFDIEQIISCLKKQ